MITKVNEWMITKIDKKFSTSFILQVIDKYFKICRNNLYYQRHEVYFDYS
jgi:hypothetical protein